MKMGRNDAALAEIERAEQLDPLSLVLRSVQGGIQFFGRNNDVVTAGLSFQVIRSIVARPVLVRILGSAWGGAMLRPAHKSRKTVSLATGVLIREKFSTGGHPRVVTWKPTQRRTQPWCVHAFLSVLPPA